MKKENEYVILTTALLGVMIGIVFAIFFRFSS
ncbi:ABC transporter ATP-binding protein [Streptococcus pneumoniae]|nr:ABC transporter ATP-binding protein [Streptococcus pneumoniae]